MSRLVAEFIDRNIGDPEIDESGIHWTPRELFLKNATAEFLSSNPFEPLCSKPISDDSTKESWYCYLNKQYGGDAKDFFKKTFSKNIKTITGKDFSFFENYDRSDALKTGTLCYRLSRLSPTGMQLLTEDHAWIEDATFTPYPKKGCAELKTSYMRELSADLLHMIYNYSKLDAYFIKKLYSYISNLSGKIICDYLNDKSEYKKFIQVLEDPVKDNEADEPLSYSLLKNANINRASRSLSERYKLANEASRPFISTPKGYDKKTTREDELQRCAVALWKFKIENLILQKSRHPPEDKFLKKVAEICIHREVLIERFKDIVVDVDINKTSIVASIPGEKNSPKNLVKCLHKFAEENKHVPESMVLINKNDIESVPFKVHHYPLKRRQLPDLHIDFWDLRYRFYEIYFIDVTDENILMWELEVGGMARKHNQLLLKFFRGHSVSTLIARY